MRARESWVVSPYEHTPRLRLPPFPLCGQQSTLDLSVKAKGTKVAGFSTRDLRDEPQVKQWDPRQRPPGIIVSPAEPRYCLRALECAALWRCDSFRVVR